MKLADIITLLEKIPTNVWSLLVITIGAILVILRHEEAGKATLASGFTLISHKT